MAPVLALPYRWTSASGDPVVGAIALYARQTARDHSRKRGLQLPPSTKLREQGGTPLRGIKPFRFVLKADLHAS